MFTWRYWCVGHYLKKIISLLFQPRWSNKQMDSLSSLKQKKYSKVLQTMIFKSLDIRTKIPRTQKNNETSITASNCPSLPPWELPCRGTGWENWGKSRKTHCTEATGESLWRPRSLDFIEQRGKGCTEREPWRSAEDSPQGFSRGLSTTTQGHVKEPERRRRTVCGVYTGPTNLLVSTSHTKDA